MFTKTKCITGSQKKVEHMIAVLGIYVTKRSFNSSQLTWIQFSYSFRNSAVFMREIVCHDKFDPQ